MLNSWITELRQNSYPELKVFLIGNKSDLNAERQVTYEEALNFMHKNNLDHFEETSAKEGLNIEEIFKKAANLLYTGYLRYIETNPSSNYVTKSIYNTLDSKHSVTLREDPNKLKERKESDVIKNQACPC